MSVYKLNHPLYPKPEVTKLYNDNAFPYRLNTIDKLYGEKWYPKIKKKEDKIISVVNQIFRVKVLNTGEEKILYDETLIGLDHNDNEKEFYHRVGKWEKPIFTKQYDEETDEVLSTEIRRHQTVYEIPYSPDRIMELAALGPTDTLALTIVTGSRNYGGDSTTYTLDEFAYSTFEQLVEKGRTGKITTEVPAIKKAKA